MEAPKRKYRRRQNSPTLARVIHEILAARDALRRLKKAINKLDKLVK